MRRLLGVGTAALLLVPAVFAQEASQETSHGVEVLRGKPTQKDRAALERDANSLRAQVHWLQTQLRSARQACGPAGATGVGGSGAAGTGGSGSAGIGTPYAAGPKVIDTGQVKGRLVWVDPAAIAVRVPGGDVLHLRVDAYTQAQRNGQVVPLASLAPGQPVRAEYLIDAGAQTATRVDLLPKPKARQARSPRGAAGSRK